VGRVTLVLLFAAATMHAAAQSTSPSYRLQPSTLSTAGRATAGSAVLADGTLAQPSTVGASASLHFITESGYWSFLGSTIVPVVLMTSRHPGSPGAIDLAWSGNNAPYAIYRATDPASIYGGAALASTSNNAYDDAAPPAGSLVCYSVLTGPPGLVPPNPDRGASP